MKKTCNRCGAEKALHDFYKHKQMPDGFLNQCKDCKKDQVRRYRSKNIEKIREYDRSRGARLSESYKSSEEYKESMKKGRKKWRANNRHKIKAHTLINKALKNGTMQKKPCRICGEIESEAHHHDYTKPLDVIWLCRKHHVEAHKKY